MPVTVKQGDTFPEVEYLLEAENDVTGIMEPVNLSTADEVKVIYLAAGGSPVSIVTTPNANQTTNPGQGTFTLPGTDVVDVYKLEFKVTWNVGQVERFPNSGYESLTIEANLGG